MAKIKQELPENVRVAGLTVVGDIIYLAISPDIADGLSDAEFESLKELGPAFFELYMLTDRLGAMPEGAKLPPGFAEHFKNDVLPNIEKVRNDPSAREQVRSEIRDTLKSPAKLDRLYREGGDTYSDMLARAVSSEEDKQELTGVLTPMPAEQSLGEVTTMPGKI